jgi:hypothetical protein
MRKQWFFVSWLVDFWVPSAKQPGRTIYNIEQ